MTLKIMQNVPKIHLIIHQVFSYVYNLNLLDGNRNKIYKGIISANSSGFRSLGYHTHTKNPTAKEKNTKFFPTFQTLSIIRNQLHLFL